MYRKLRTLRMRLVLLSLGVFGAIQITLSILTLYISEGFFRLEFDQRLTDGVIAMQAVVDVHLETGAAGIPRARIFPHRNPFVFLDYYFQVRATGGQVIECSANLGSEELPFSAVAQRAIKTLRPVLETVEDPQLLAHLGRRYPLRLATLYSDEPGEEPHFIQVAVGLSPIYSSVSSLRRAVFTLVPIGLAVAAAASWALVRRSLGPIGRIAREARELTAAQLDRRLPLPPGRDEVYELVETLNDMLSRLEGAFLSQERFVANAAHELRTPVTHLLGQAQVLLRSSRSLEAYAQFVGVVQDEMRVLAQVVESLLLLARADAGLPLRGRQTVSLNEVVVDAVERCRVYADQRLVRIEPTLAMPMDGETEPEVLGDHELLVTTVGNILRNAIRHSPPGQLVQLDVQSDAHERRISVRDRGPGIPAEQLPHLFERFFQVSRPADERKGSGLGLAIAQSAARIHGGMVTVQNRPDGGCEFSVHLPRDRGHQDLRRERA